MSFGLHDKDWVDPDPEVFVRCHKCDRWDACPCCGEMGVCAEDGEWRRFDDGCYQEVAK